MKVLFINTNDTSGGAARAAMRIMRGVQQNGVEAQMFVKNKNSQAEDVIPLSSFVPSDIIYHACDWIANKIKNKWQHYKWRPYKHTKQNLYLSDLRSISLHDALQKLDYDIVHLHWINNRFLDLRELKKINKPIVWTLHDSWPFCGICHIPYECEQYKTHCGNCPILGSTKENDIAYEVFEKKLLAYKDLDLHIVAPSHWLAECVKKSALLGRFPVTVIPNCLDTNLYKPMDKEQVRQLLGLSPEKKYLLFGAMQATKDPNKGFDLLLNALNEIEGTNTELLVYGTNENLEKYNIPIPVHSLGYIHTEERMVEIYNAADVTIVPSRSENLSNTIMESMSCGTPVVAFNIGGNGDMIDHKKNGYLANENDSEDLANGISWCLRNNAENILGKAAREKVLNLYSPEIVCRQYKELYLSLNNNPSL